MNRRWGAYRVKFVAVAMGAMLAGPVVGRTQSLPASAGTEKVLSEVADVALPGPAVRFDYQSLDAVHGRLYIAHMNADRMVVFDTAKRVVVADLDGYKRVHGVLAVPERDRIYASNTGDHALAAVDARTLKVVGTAGPIQYPDGIAYDPVEDKVFVSDEHGGVDAVVDAKTNRLIANIGLGGGAGNTVYDAGEKRILVAVHTVNELVAVDPVGNTITARYKLAGIENPHGIALDEEDRLAFIAGEENHSLALFDLKAMQVVATYSVGDDPDVLAFDAGLKRLYVAAESGNVSVFQLQDGRLLLLGSVYMAHAHTVSVDPKTHLVYLPLENIDGHAVLRIMKPGDAR